MVNTRIFPAWFCPPCGTVISACQIGSPLCKDDRSKTSDLNSSPPVVVSPVSSVALGPRFNNDDTDWLMRELWDALREALRACACEGFLEPDLLLGGECLLEVEFSSSAPSSCLGDADSPFDLERPFGDCCLRGDACFFCGDRFLEPDCLLDSCLSELERFLDADSLLESDRFSDLEGFRWFSGDSFLRSPVSCPRGSDGFRAGACFLESSLDGDLLFD